MERLDDATRHAYRSAFRQAVADGQAKPLLIPYSVLGAFIVPALWLTIPHTHRPWLYQTRWLVVAFVVLFNINVARQSSSTNMACAYAAGLMASWGVVLNMNLLVWKRPQFEAARAIRVLRKATHERTDSTLASATSPQTSHGLRSRNIGVPTAGPRTQEFESMTDAELSRSRQDISFQYPDFADAYKRAGWNWSISSIPRPKIPAKTRLGDRVDLNSMPRVTGSGYERCLTERQFIRKHVVKILIMYCILDLLSVSMMMDPYFIHGPDNASELPRHLQRLSPWVIIAYRELLCLSGVLAALDAVFAVNNVVQYWLFKTLWPSRAALWHYSSTFGSFSLVLDKGLAGWWGDWWHQTFRQQFLAPSLYLQRRGYLREGSQTAAAVAMFLSFFQSGLLHAFGSMSSIPETRPWRSPLFFLLQVAGISIQDGLAKVMKRRVPNPPRMLTRIANFLFTFVWMYATSTLFIDDISSSGLWLLEPVPISPLRWLGYGHPTDHWWRWDRDHFPKWHSGAHWWETGIAL
ncbi:hypothetical protein DCS_07550 [Drechmeria coniospora]|uniref:Wax synthase domain-containing protein n=1 Tax=Drechmeria coniospora TaxID=98403 RepID=A0A151GER2_DRECN|nr:hypothetical protein DCS_07550 [Drechmeria coniospora]KYK55587.1 hypothetical protein DCS_07550 [Drechmeria coniospora]